MKASPKAPGSQAGFSALEALIALAIVAIALVPLLDLQRQVTRGVVRQQALYADAAGAQDALTLLRDMNPMVSPTGAVPHRDGGRIAWRAQPITRATQTTLGGTGYGPFEVQLFRVEIDVTAPSGAPIAEFTVEKLGWRPASTPRVRE